MKEQLTRIYNTLGLIQTKGEDTIYMAQSLIALQQIIESIPNEEKKDNQEVE